MISNAVSNMFGRKPKIFWVCKGNIESQYQKWSITDEGNRFKNSGLKWYEWETNIKNMLNSKIAVTKKDTTSALNNHENNDFSTYLCAIASSSMKNAWGLDIMCSCHLIPHRDAFISQIKYFRVPIDVANGETIYLAGKGDIRTFWKISK